MSEPIALIDMDGTLCDFDGAMLRDLATIQSPNEPPLPSDIFNDDGPDRAWLKARRRMIKCMPDWWLNLEPLPLGMDILNLLIQQGFEAHILTKGPKVPEEAWSQKAKWVRRHLGRDIKITITEDKSTVYGKVLVDDWPGYIERWLQFRPRGLVLMPTQEWNLGFRHPNVRRVTALDCKHGGDIVRYSQGLLNLVKEIKNRRDGKDWDHVC